MSAYMPLSRADAALFERPKEGVTPPHFSGGVYKYLKGHQMAGFLTNDGEELGDKLTESIQDLLNRPELVKSACALPQL